MRMIELSEDDYATLLLALGYAAGSASKQGDAVLFSRFLQLADTISATNPNWRPYTTNEPAS